MQSVSGAPKKCPEDCSCGRCYFQKAVELPHSNNSFSTAAKSLKPPLFIDLERWNMIDSLAEEMSFGVPAKGTSKARVLDIAEADFTNKFFCLNGSRSKYQFNQKESSSRVFIDCVIFAALSMLQDESLKLEFEQMLTVPTKHGRFGGSLDYYITDSLSIHVVIEAKKFGAFEHSASQLALQLQAARYLWLDEKFQEYAVCGVRSDGVRYQFLTLDSQGTFYASPVYRVKGINLGENLKGLPEKTISELALILAWMLESEDLRGCLLNKW